MNRIDRLTAIILFLQGGKRTAAEIARRFEVSRRTIARDLEALSEMGVPLVAEQGVNGGYSLLPDYSMPPLALDFHEAVLLRLALSSITQLGSLPFANARVSLMEKIAAVIPPRYDEDLATLEKTLTSPIPQRSQDTPFLDRLVEAVTSHQPIRVQYRSQNGLSSHIIQPLQVQTINGLWYCEAYSYDYNESRIYRVDRFQEIKPAQLPVVPPEAFPSAIPDKNDTTHPEVAIRLSERGRLMVERNPIMSQFIREFPEENVGSDLKSAETGKNKEGHFIIAHFPPQDYNWVLQVVLSLGLEAEILYPPELRLRVCQAAQEIVQFYS